MNKAILMTLVLTLAVTVGTVAAQTESVYVDLLFNVGAVDEMTVTLLGESAVTSAVGGTATPANIEFNLNSSTQWLNATVTGGGETQNTTNPILSIDNTGTTNLQLNISINATLAACLDLRYINDSAAYDISALDPNTNGVQVSNTNITIDSSFTPAEATWGVWLYGNSSGCTDGDDDVVRFTMWGTRL